MSLFSSPTAPTSLTALAPSPTSGVLSPLRAGILGQAGSVWPCLCVLALLLALGGCASSENDEDPNLARLSKMSSPNTGKQAAKKTAPSAKATSPAPKSDLLHPAPATAAPTAAITQQDLTAPQQQQPAPMGKTQVAILLPLSGKSAPLGQAMLNAAQLAVFDIAPQSFELMPRDTGATSDSAALAARDAIASGAQLLIGPLFASDVAAVRPIVQTSAVNMLSLSTDISLAEPGAYVMGFAPAPQVTRITTFAASRGARRFAAIIPTTPYGHLVRKAFEEAVHAQDGQIVAIDTPAHAAAVLEKKDQIDALFLPLSGGEIQKIAPALSTAALDTKRIHLLGTGLWDEEGLIQKYPALAGGWYAGADPAARAAFESNYKKTYSKAPPRIATLAYDATALAAVLAGRGHSFDRAALGNPSGFAGIDGIFRMTPDGHAERGLAVIELTGEGVVIDPAPNSFVR